MPHSTYLPERMGTATISPTGKFAAGSFESFTLVYTAGYFGIDDTGSIKIVHRFASDMGRPQWSDPKAPNYTTVEASNGAVLDVLYDPKLNIRPVKMGSFRYEVRVVHAVRGTESVSVRVRAVVSDDDDSSQGWRSRVKAGGQDPLTRTWCR